jgi:glycosyltransferase involved in cell wall biosynthesis
MNGSLVVGRLHLASTPFEAAIANMCISILVLTLNEEANLPGCLESVAWSDDVVVFDSCSTDRTVAIAEAAAARVVQRKFDNYAAQQNAALTEVEYKHRWLLLLGADERATPELAAEIRHVVEKGDQRNTLYRLRRKDMFLGTWLRRSSGYPTWFGRLIRVGRVWVEREVNEEYHTDGKIQDLHSHIVHFPFNKGISFWFERHNRYSSMEAELLLREVRGKMKVKDFFSSDPTVRRKTLKQLAYRLPGRPLLVFTYLFFLRMGFLDGRPGLIYCTLRMIYEYMIDLKVKELRRREKGLPI